MSDLKQQKASFDAQWFRQRAGNKLADIADMLQPGAKLTLVVRFPDYPERDIILTDDTTDGAVEALERRRPGWQRPA